MWVVVTAAGSGRRMGEGNKLLLQLAGVPILVRSLRVFQELARVQGVAVSAPPAEVDDYRQLFGAEGLSKVRWVVPGGKERQDSIREALAVLPGLDDDAVAIHDAARPLLRPELVERLAEALPGCDGVLPMVGVKDTIKEVHAGRVERTLDRSRLFAAQTPQVFGLGAIRRAHERARQEEFPGTDDASLIEWQGGHVRMVPGDYANLKVTTREDLELAEILLRALEPV